MIAVAIITMLPATSPSWVALMVTWLFLGAATALILTPSARLLRRSSNETNRPAVFAAQFSLSHACFIITYPTAGILGALVGIPATALVLAGVGAVAALVASFAWQRPAPSVDLSDREQRFHRSVD